MDSTIEKLLPLKGMAYTEKTASTKITRFRWNDWLLLKETAFTKWNGFMFKEGLPLKGMASTKMNGFH